MAYNRKDFFFKEAKKKNFAARSVFKLEEIDQRYRVFKKGWTVLDLGAAPGSWSQYASSAVGPQGKVLGVDLQPVRVSLPNATFIQADLFDLDLVKTFEDHGFIPPFEAVISDMAPRTTGIKVQDQARSLEICELALNCAVRFLKPNGNFICKMFQGDDFDSFRDQLREKFGQVEVLRPKSTRKASKEIFFICKKFNGSR